ncbi:MULTISPECIES: ATP-binding protein [unclassified Moorena]|uniref:sensor histidine kinase n=1 Tax=unclassified Moorena TaxID=2683338 RepID=UPI0014015754|nr:MULTISPECIES: ATP-binding protein [unclassified Moorena]NEO13938.1 PAS domain-containing sensor histidine kinase [Moorena sp. SIO3E8]NEP99999.1 PAS domain-containing sensor histidine kinase [Moorena sp. SIO3F7]
MLISRRTLPPSSCKGVKPNPTVHKNFTKWKTSWQPTNQTLAEPIIDRKRVEESLLAVQQRYRSLFENSTDGIFKITPDGYYIACNPSLARLYGYESPNQFLSHVTGVGEYLHKDPQRRYQFLELLHSKGFVEEFESQVSRQDGTLMWICESAWAVRDATGYILYYEGFVKDITKQKLTEAALQAAQAKLEAQSQELENVLKKLQLAQEQLKQSETMSTLGQLCAGVVHEINNPLNFICGNVTPARDYSEDLLRLLGLYVKHYPQPVAEIQQYADAIDLDFLIQDFPKALSSMGLGAERLQQIVQSVRHFSRQQTDEKQRVNIHQGIDSTLTILHNRLKPKGNNPGITVTKDYGKLPLVECYSGPINQVLMNLLCNAIDALEEAQVNRFFVRGSSPVQVDRFKVRVSPQSSDSPQGVNQKTPALPNITIRTEFIGSNGDLGDSSGGQVVIRIIDNGPGMTEEVKQKIFEPFFTTKSIDKGTGLGLDICRKIVVEQHGGQILCTSNPGKGTEFAIAIPVGSYHKGLQAKETNQSPMTNDQ